MAARISASSSSDDDWPLVWAALSEPQAGLLEPPELLELFWGDLAIYTKISSLFGGSVRNDQDNVAS